LASTLAFGALVIPWELFECLGNGTGVDGHILYRILNSKMLPLRGHCHILSCPSHLEMIIFLGSRPYRSCLFLPAVRELCHWHGKLDPSVSDEMIVATSQKATGTGPECASRNHVAIGMDSAHVIAASPNPQQQQQVQLRNDHSRVYSQAYPNIKSTSYQCFRICRRLVEARRRWQCVKSSFLSLNF
jgi:hypothetical protein